MREKGISSTVLIAIVIIAAVAGGIFLYVDWDEDNLKTYEEIFDTGTDFLNQNTDGDKWPDGKEVSRGADPLKVDIPTADAGKSYETEEVHNREGKAKTIELNAENSRDPNGSIEKYSWRIVDDPSQGSSLSSKNSPTPIFHPPDHVDSNTQVKVELTTTDNSGVSAKDTATIIVKPFNEPPEILSRSPETDSPYVKEPNNQSFSISVEDEEGGKLKYFWDGDVESSGTSSAFKGFWDSDHGDENLEISVTVKDNQGKSGSTSWDLTIKDINRLPSIEMGSPYSVDEDHWDTDYTVKLENITYSDPEGDNLSYKWEIVSGPGSLTETNSLNPVYHSPSEVSSVTDVEIKLTANDGYDETSATTTVKVKPYTEPAKFEISNLNVDPSKVNPGETVSISVDVRNIGEATGDHTVKLRVNENIEKSQTVTLEGGGSTTVSFKLQKREEKKYSVEIGKLSDSFEVTTTLITEHYEWTDHRGEEWTWDISFERWRYEEYRNRSHQAYTGSDYLEFVTYNDERIKSMADELSSKYSDLEDEANFILSYVQSLSYREESGEYIRYPIGTLIENGDCEDTAILYAALMKAAGQDVALIHFEDHMMAGVNLLELPQYGTQDSIYWFEENGKRYYTCEATGIGWHVGDLPEQYHGESARVYIVD